MIKPKNGILNRKQSLSINFELLIIVALIMQNFITDRNVLDSKKVDSNEIRHIHV